MVISRVQTQTHWKKTVGTARDAPTVLIYVALFCNGTHLSAVMLPKVANHLLLHTSRAVALVQNQTCTIRNVLQHQSSGSTSSAAPWAAGPGSSWGSSGAGAGPGGAKFNAGSKFYTGYTVSFFGLVGNALIQVLTRAPVAQ